MENKILQMTFVRFLDIILRSIMLNVWLIALLFCLSIPLNGDIFFFSYGNNENLLMLSLFIFINIIHWIMETLVLFKKCRPDDAF